MSQSKNPETAGGNKELPQTSKNDRQLSAAHQTPAKTAVPEQKSVKQIHGIIKNKGEKVDSKITPVKTRAGSSTPSWNMANFLSDFAKPLFPPKNRVIEFSTKQNAIESKFLTVRSTSRERHNHGQSTSKLSARKNTVPLIQFDSEEWSKIEKNGRWEERKESEEAAKESHSTNKTAIGDKITGDSQTPATIELVTTEKEPEAETRAGSLTQSVDGKESHSANKTPMGDRITGNSQTATVELVTAEKEPEAETRAGSLTQSVEQERASVAEKPLSDISLIPDNPWSFPEDFGKSILQTPGKQSAKEIINASASVTNTSIHAFHPHKKNAPIHEAFRPLLTSTQKAPSKNSVAVEKHGEKSSSDDSADESDRREKVVGNGDMQIFAELRNLANLLLPTSTIREQTLPEQHTGSESPSQDTTIGPETQRFRYGKNKKSVETDANTDTALSEPQSPQLKRVRFESSSPEPVEKDPETEARAGSLTQAAEEEDSDPSPKAVEQEPEVETQANSSTQTVEKGGKSTSPKAVEKEPEADTRAGSLAKAVEEDAEKSYSQLEAEKWDLKQRNDALDEILQIEDDINNGHMNCNQIDEKYGKYRPRHIEDLGFTPVNKHSAYRFCAPFCRLPQFVGINITEALLARRRERQLRNVPKLNKKKLSAPQNLEKGQQTLKLTMPAAGKIIGEPIIIDEE